MSFLQAINSGALAAFVNNLIPDQTGNILFRKSDAPQVFQSGARDTVLFTQILVENNTLDYDILTGIFSNNTQKPINCTVSYSISMSDSLQPGQLALLSFISCPFYPLMGLSSTLEINTPGQDTNMSSCASFTLPPAQTFSIEFEQNTGADTNVTATIQILF